MKVELRKVSINKRLSEETTCFSADLWIDGAKAGIVSNRGHGGPNDVHIPDRALRTAFETFCLEQPPTEPEPPHIPALAMSVDLFVSLLLEAYEERLALKRKSKKTTFFRLKSHVYKPDEWHAVQAPFSEAVRQHLINRHGDDLQEIANDSF